MQGRNNLSNHYSNSYFQVTESFEVFVRVGWSKSNTFYGSTQLCGGVYRKVVLQPGDEIHDLVGGLFVLTGDRKQGQFVTIEINTTHPFLRNSTNPEEWPLSKLEACRPSDVGYNTEVPMMEPGTLVGGLHSVVS